jgi:hypothetical protein
MTTLELALATAISVLATRAAHASCNSDETNGGADICVDTHTAAPAADDHGSAGGDMLVFFPKNDINQINSTTKLLLFLPGTGGSPFDYMQFNVIDVPSEFCGGHTAPITDKCLAKQAKDMTMSTSWFPTVWKLILARTFALPPRS